MNLTHTPAPWDIEYSARNYWYIEHVQGGETYTLTKLDCGAADARLMAAAPELLMAAHAALADLEGIAPEIDPSGDRQHPVWETIKELRAAIAKATGELV